MKNLLVGASPELNAVLGGSRLRVIILFLAVDV